MSCMCIDCSVSKSTNNLDNRNSCAELVVVAVCETNTYFFSFSELTFQFVTTHRTLYRPAICVYYVICVNKYLQNNHLAFEYKVISVYIWNNIYNFGICMLSFSLSPISLSLLRPPCKCVYMYVADHKNGFQSSHIFYCYFSFSRFRFLFQSFFFFSHRIIAINSQAKEVIFHIVFFSCSLRFNSISLYLFFNVFLH